MPWTKTATDDVTGEIHPESDASEIKITVGDASGVLVIGADTLAALTALASGDAGPLRILLTPDAPAPRAGRKRASGGTREGKPDAVTGATSAEMREWGSANGHASNARGRVPAELVAAYRAAHPGKPSAPAAQASASGPGKVAEAK